MAGVRQGFGSAWGAAKKTNRKQRTGGLAAVVLLATAPFGGLHHDRTPAPAPFQTGHAYDIGPFDVTVKRVVSLPSLGAITPDAAGDRLLVIDAIVTNPTQRPEYASEVVADPITNDLVLFGSGTGAVPWQGEASPVPRIYRVADSSRLDGTEVINPGITDEVAIVLQQQGGWDEPSITLGLNGYDFQAVDPLTLDDDRWVLGGTVVEGTVPVEVKQ